MQDEQDEQDDEFKNDSYLFDNLAAMLFNACGNSNFVFCKRIDIVYLFWHIIINFT